MMQTQFHRWDARRSFIEIVLPPSRNYVPVISSLNFLSLSMTLPVWFLKSIYLFSIQLWCHLLFFCLHRSFTFLKKSFKCSFLALFSGSSIGFLSSFTVRAMYSLFTISCKCRLSRRNWMVSISYHCHRSFYERMVYLALYAYFYLLFVLLSNYLTFILYCF